MDRSIKTKLNEFIQDKIIKRKAMFIPIGAVAAFMLVGYAAVDKEKPEIITDQVDLAYGEKLDQDMLNIVDNGDDTLDIKLDTTSLDIKQLGEYDVEVTATDKFSNEAIKTITVNVVDEQAPIFTQVSSEKGYVVEVPYQGSDDIANYIKASDNVDGDVTSFVEQSLPLDTNKLGEQIITLAVSDNAGNNAKEDITFVVADTEAPVITLNGTNDISVDLNSTFDINNYMTISDNIDANPSIEVKGDVDTSKVGNTATVTVTVKDSSNNTTTQELNITVQDISGPQITLNTDMVTIKQGEGIDPKSYLVSAIDNTDGDLTGNVTFNTIDTNVTGTQAITYSVSDSNNNISNVNLTVNVEMSGQGIVSVAQTKLGCPYVWGATGPTTFDCSGFTQWVYRQNGISIPRTSSEQRSSAPTVVSVSEAQVGDILWRSGHVGIYIGNGQYIHAPHTGDVVKISSLSSSSFTNALRYN